MRIGLMGLGVVGDAVARVLATGHELLRYDPPKGLLDDLRSARLIFVCVPTPYDEASGRFDPSYLRSALGHLDQLSYKGVVAIKSTTLPTVLDELIKEGHGYSIVGCPEFLNARTAYEDFKASKVVVIGGELISSTLVYEAHQVVLPDCVPFYLKRPGEAMMVKYAINSFFAVKNAFFNSIYDLCGQLDYDWQSVVRAVRADGRIHPVHTYVPGPDGQLGFGGACLPKDISSLLDLMDGLLGHGELLEAALSINRKVRRHG
jgi:UDPglucose 6-dehydrogenase